MRVLYALMAKRVSQDSRTNVTSLFEVVEEITVAMASDVPETGIVAVPMEVAFTILWEREGHESEGVSAGEFFVETPRGEWIRQPIEVDFQGQLRARTTVELAVFPVAGEGIYTFHATCLDADASWAVSEKVQVKAFAFAPIVGTPAFQEKERD